MHGRPQQHSGDCGFVRFTVATLLLVLAGVMFASGSIVEELMALPEESTAPPRAVPAPEVTPVVPLVSEAQAPAPVRVRVPVVDIDAAVGPLFIDGNGVLSPPGSYSDAGWWRDGPEPGEAGPAVVAGHVDGVEGPAAFFRLDEIEPGARIFIDRADGSTAIFVAQRTERHAKDEFPTDAVYGPTPDSRLRLVTCGGFFDNTVRRYEDNVIVFAVRAAG